MSEFRIYPSEMFVVYDSNNSSKSILKQMHRTLFGGTDRLPPYGMNAHKLAALMNDWRERNTIDE